MDKIQTIKNKTEELLKTLIDSFEVDVIDNNGIIYITIKTETDAPTIIGRHGETIRAIQKILEVMFYKTFREPIDILVNVNDFREKQKERLEHLATEMVSKTEETKQSSYIRGLSSFERKIVHEYITNKFPNITTYSVGDGRDRRLVINLKENEQQKEEVDPSPDNE